MNIHIQLDKNIMIKLWGGQYTKYALLMFFENVEITRLLGGPMDPKSAVGGPKPISRTGGVRVIITALPQYRKLQGIFETWN